MKSSQFNQLQLLPSDTDYFEARNKSLHEVHTEWNALQDQSNSLEVLDSARYDNQFLHSVTASELQACLDTYAREAENKQLTLFIPAAGAASRQFQLLKTLCNPELFPAPQTVHSALQHAQTRSSQLQSQNALSQAEQAEQKQLQEVIRDLPRFWSEGIVERKFAFVEALHQIYIDQGQDFEHAVHEADIQGICRAILDTEKGLGYSFLPKALLLFHQYKTQEGYSARTALEEHIRALVHLFEGQPRIQLHLAISEEHEDAVQAQLNDLWNDAEFVAYIQKHQRTREEVSITWSFQHASTDAIALDIGTQQLARTPHGTPLVRKAGHGALIENVAQLDADGIWIQNIDNILYENPAIHHAVCVTKKWMAGLAFQTQRAVHSMLRTLHTERTTGQLTEATWSSFQALLSHTLHIQLPNKVQLERRDIDAIDACIQILDRPLVIAGYVPLRPGQKGGGPFVVRTEWAGVEIYKTNTVEGSEFDGGQEHPIFQSGICFNPVNLFIATERYDGTRFDLRNYTDPKRFFLSQKTDPEGRPIQAYERPGLWNGALSNALQISIGTLACTFGAVKNTSGAESFLAPLHQAGVQSIVTELDYERGVVSKETERFFKLEDV